MALEDVKARIAAEQQAQTAAAAQAKAAADAAKAAQDKKIAELKAAEKTKKDATRLEKERKQLEGIIKQLASGDFEEGSRGYQTLLGEATKLDSSVKTLESRLKISEAGKAEMVGELPAQRVPFGGKTVSGAKTTTKTPAAGMETQDLEVKTPSKTPTKTPAKTSAKIPKETKTPEVKLTREEILAKYPIIDALFDED